MSTYPHRLRLHGGRNTHAAKIASGLPDNLVTACGYIEGPRDERKDDDAPITCRNCTRIEETSR
ncbi:hypothetical protein ACFVX9_30535 [Kitasatospora sp. NPDC058243]|uniref:hypothetical protein n=1 Tax=Kitasatospora sp. NPDC058243 TaxID=3346397 RepID=UPI0036D86A65